MQHKKSRRYAPCGTISCFIRLLFSLALLVPCVLLTCSLRSKTEHFRGPRTAPKVLNFPANRRRETYWKVGKISACWTSIAWCWPCQTSGDFFAFHLIFGLILRFFRISDSNFILVYDARKTSFAPYMCLAYRCPGRRRTTVRKETWLLFPSSPQN